MIEHNFIATFAPGFEPCISDVLLRSVPEALNLRVFSGMIVFSSYRIPSVLLNAGVFNNIFLILKEWNSPSISFADMVNSSIKKDCLNVYKSLVSELIQTNFRVRFSHANQFTKVDRVLMQRSEQYISKSIGLLVDRLSSGNEFWFLIRNEGFSFFMLRLTQRDVSLNELHQGELRPEIAMLLVAYASPKSTDVIVVDPFAGYGSIPEQLSQFLPQSLVYASDSNAEMVTFFKKRFRENPRIVSNHSDARNLDFIPSGSVNLVVTDPPWGNWNSETYTQKCSIVDLYEEFLKELARILADNGRACILTGAKREFEDAVAHSASFSHSLSIVGKPSFRTDVLVNGKKAAVFLIHKERKL